MMAAADHCSHSNDGEHVSRAEWIASAALAISMIQGAYVAGVEVQRLNDHDRRLTSLEAQQNTSTGKIEQLLVTTSRIDANVSGMAELAKERREAAEK